MRIIETQGGSFPEAVVDRVLSFPAGQEWQVLCGDHEHWRVGIYSPAHQSLDQLQQLEQHNCPELFVLLEGEMTLVLALEGELISRPLPKGQPILVTAPHNGYCPQGPHSGTALVVERDHFTTEYRSINQWLSREPLI
jgi:hypothetical protein